MSKKKQEQLDNLVQEEEAITENGPFTEELPIETYQQLKEKAAVVRDHLEDVKYQKWLQVFTDNYFGRSELSKTLDRHLKQTYKNMNYLPWATMERLTYMLDPKAKFNKVRNSKGGFVHTDSFIIRTTMPDGRSTEVTVASHTVVVRLTFMGIEFEEVYPLQDNNNEAPKVYDQNIVNRSLQRATARLAARATGLGLQLYENGELPSPEDFATTAPASVELNSSKEETKPELSAEDMVAFVRTFASKDKLEEVFKGMELLLMKQYGFTISCNDSDAELIEKFSKFKNLKKFSEAVQMKLGGK